MQKAVDYPWKPTVTYLSQYVHECYRYRHLMMHLARSDLRGRFRGSYVGGLWLLLNPLIFTGIFTVIFGSIFNAPVREYAPYVLLGVVLWEFVSGMTSMSTQSILSAEGYLKQARIPLLVFCLRTLVYLLVCFLVGLISALVVAALIADKFSLIMVPWLVPAAILAVVFTAPIGIISAVATTRWRDYQPAIAHLLMVMYYLSPVFIVRKEFDRPELQWFSDYNPITSLCDVFRDPVLYAKAPELHDVIVILVWGGIFWVAAIYALRKTEADTIHYF